MAPAASFITVRKTVVPPAGGRADPPVRVPLSGCDLIYDGFNVKAAFFFRELLSPQLLKQSLAKALDAFPIMAGRARHEGGAHWIDCCGSGAVVRERIARVTGTPALAHGETGPFMLDFAAGPFNTKANDPGSPILTVTLTEVTYGEAFSCRPAQMASCRCAPDSAEDAEEGAGQGAGAVPTDGGEGAIRYALGISFSHTAADGCAAAHFMANWARAGGGLALQPAVNARGLLLDEGPLDSERLPPPAKYKLVSSLGRARVMGAFTFNQMRCETVILRFPREEVEAIKARAMGPLAGTDQWVSTSNALAAHLWPLLSALLQGQKHPPSAAASSTEEGERGEGHLVPLSVVVNSRRQLQMPGHYCGNVVSMQDAPRAGAADSLTARALKVRHASAPTPLEARRDHQYMQRVKSQGRAPIRNLMYARMRDMCLGRPALVWDDVSSFQAPGGDTAVLSFAGATPVGMDLFLFSIPGMMFVVAPPPSEAPGGKEVRVGLPIKLARRLRSAEWQARVHQFRPWPNAAEADAASKAAVEEQKEEPRTTEA